MLCSLEDNCHDGELCLPAGSGEIKSAEVLWVKKDQSRITTELAETE